MTPGPATTAAQAQAARAPVFASFLLGGEEFAIDVRQVQEVVRRPPRLLNLPLQPAFAEGVFNLRGSIIPLLSTGRLLGREATADGIDAKVAIVQHGGMRLGLACDDTSRVLRPRPEEVAKFDFAEGSAHPVVAGVIKLTDGLLTVLDLERLMALHDVPRPAHDAQADAWSRSRRIRKRCITFRVGSIGMALPIGDIHEIVVARSLDRSPIQDPMIAGVLGIRQQIVPVMRLARLMRDDDPGLADPAAPGPDARIIVLQLGHGHVGILVDAVEAIELYADEQCLPVPALSRRRAGLFTRCIDLGERGQVFLLDAAQLLQEDAVARLAGQHSALFKGQEAEHLRTVRQGKSRAPFLWFRAGLEFAVQMREIREIVELRSPLIEMPGAPHHVCGMLNLRGRMVTVIDVQAFLQLKQAPSSEQELAKVLVVDAGDALVGLRVSTVQSIVHVSNDDRYAVPRLMRLTLPETLRNDVHEVVRATDAQQTAVDLLVLNLQRLIECVSAPA